MAARLSADLGLHLDIAEQARHGLLSPRDLLIRQTAYQGVFIHERFGLHLLEGRFYGSPHANLQKCSMWGLYVGRPGWIGTVTVPRPTPQFHFDSPSEKIWAPYRLGAEGQSTEVTKIPFQVEACADANVSLCVFMRRISDAL